MEFLLTSTSDYHGDCELLEYASKLKEKGFIISSVRKFNSPITYIEYTIKINSVEDMMELINTVENPIIISTSTKGDPPQIEIYDNYRE